MKGAATLALASPMTTGGCAPSPSMEGPWTTEHREWVHSAGGIAGRRTTPAEQGVRVRYAFGAEGTLVVSDPCADCFEHTFVRLR